MREKKVNLKRMSTESKANSSPLEEAATKYQVKIETFFLLRTEILVIAVIIKP